jgi:hypothetical protein
MTRCAALWGVKGVLPVGVINSIGYPGDTKAIGALEQPRHDAGAEVAQAADAALARIRIGELVRQGYSPIGGSQVAAATK